jgi:hypothetical protein
MESSVASKDNEMRVFVLIREDQNEHGYIDTSITGVFRDARVAMEMETLERLHAREEGLAVEDDESPDAEWQVSWKVEEHLLD